MPNLTKVRLVRTASVTRARLASGRHGDPAARPSPRSSPTIGDPAPHHRDRIPAVVWARADMRERLRDRDIAGVYRLLQSHGVSQRAIAARTGQSQSEVSEIVAGRRQVAAYDLLVRIAEGLGVPRGWMGLAYDEPSLPESGVGR